MATRSFPWRKTFVVGFGFFGISIIWPLFNSLIPPMLEDLGLAAVVIGFILTWDKASKRTYPGNYCSRQATPLNITSSML
jgi:hypothetical protein